MLLACLGFHNSSYGASKFQGFMSIARQLGHQVETVSHDGSLEGYRKAYDQASILSSARNGRFSRLTFAQWGCEGGKEKSLAWLDRLNEIRRMIGHPLKNYVPGYKFSDEEKRFLAHCDDLVLKLLNRMKSVS
jgi:hypothetical protein